VKVLTKYVKHAENKLKNTNTDRSDVLSQKATSKIVKKQEVGKEEGKRYLFEIFTPKITASYLHHNINRQLVSEDVEHLCNSKFENWKLFLIRTLFRMEFNMYDAIPTKLTDKYLLEDNNKLKRKKVKKLKIKNNLNSSKDTSEKEKSDDNKEKVVTKEYRENKKNIQFWFD
jgi:hypothetical protein